MFIYIGGPLLFGPPQCIFWGGQDPPDPPPPPPPPGIDAPGGEGPFILVFAINSAKKRREFLAKTFLFWSAGMVAARWNLVWTGCGPLVQKVADPCSTATIRFVKVFTSIIFCLAGLLSYHS